MLQPRHERRVRLAACDVGRMDEVGTLDDWSTQWLRRVRSEARAAGHDPEEVNDWTMDGVLRGRQEACA